MTFHSCPKLHSCPPTMIMCEDGSCSIDLSQCTNHKCGKKELKCWDGKCVSDPSLCSTRPTCPPVSPIMCPDGTCVNN